MHPPEHCARETFEGVRNFENEFAPDVPRETCETQRRLTVKFRHCALALVLVLAAAPVLAAETAPAGNVKVLSGTAYIIRGSQVIPAQLGQPVYESDRVRTGADGRLGITLKDDTRFSLGPSSEVHLSRFAYAPAEGQLALALKVVRGVAAYVSGRIAKLSPDAVRLETPGAIAGVRGTTLAFSVSPE